MQLEKYDSKKGEARARDAGECRVRSGGKHLAVQCREECVEQLEATRVVRSASSARQSLTRRQLARGVRAQQRADDAVQARELRGHIQQAGQGTHSRQKSGLVLVEVMAPGGRGVPCRFCKGESLAKPYVAKGFKALDDGQLEANLARYTTDAGREYFATVEGQAELARLVRFIQRRKVNPRR